MLIKGALFVSFLLIPTLLSASHGFDPSGFPVIKYKRNLNMTDVKISFDKRFVLSEDLYEMEFENMVRASHVCSEFTDDYSSFNFLLL